MPGITMKTGVTQGGEGGSVVYPLNNFVDPDKNNGRRLDRRTKIQNFKTFFSCKFFS